MQTDGLWLSVGIGAGLGAAYVAASFISNRRALRSKRHPMPIVVAAMMLRMFVALIALVVTTMLLPVAPKALVGSFFVIFVIGLALEIWTLHRRAESRLDAGS